jgi:F0F1-type ATP synthase membrane subunit b/b'
MRYTVIFCIILFVIFSGQALYVSAETGSHGDVHGDGHGGEEHSNALFFWKTMCFLAILILLVIGLRKTIGNFFSKRSSTISNEIDSAKDELETVKQANAEMETRVSRLSQEVDEMKAENEKIVAQTVKKLEEDEKQKLERMEKLIESKIASEYASTRNRAMLLTVEHALEKVSSKFKDNPDLVSDFRHNFEEILNQVKIK